MHTHALTKGYYAIILKINLPKKPVKYFNRQCNTASRNVDLESARASATYSRGVRTATALKKTQTSFNSLVAVVVVTVHCAGDTGNSKRRFENKKFYR